MRDLGFLGRSRDPKRGVGTRRLKYLFLAAYVARDGFAAKLNLTRLLHDTAGNSPISRQPYNLNKSIKGTTSGHTAYSYF